MQTVDLELITIINYKYHCICDFVGYITYILFSTNIMNNFTDELLLGDFFNL